MSSSRFHPTLFQITTPHFVAGFIIAPFTESCVTAAPIIKYFKSKPLKWIHDYSQIKRWTVQLVSPIEERMARAVSEARKHHCYAQREDHITGIYACKECFNIATHCLHSLLQGE